MIISKKEFFEKQELAKPIIGKLNYLSECSLPDFYKEIEKSEPWNGLRIDLFHYIKILNRIDELFENYINKYELDKEFPILQQMDSDDEFKLQILLEYSYRLLEHSHNKEIYNSVQRVYDLLKSYSIKVKISALKLCCLLCERFQFLNNEKFHIPTNVKNLLLDLCTFFPPHIAPTYSTPTPISLSSHKNKNNKHSSNNATLNTSSSSGSTTTASSNATANRNRLHKKLKNNHNKLSSSGLETQLLHISLLDCINPESQLPKEWKCLDFQYYKGITESAKKHKKRNLEKQNINKKEKNQLNSSQSLSSESQIESPLSSPTKNRKNSNFQILNSQSGSNSSDSNNPSSNSTTLNTNIKISETKSEASSTITTATQLSSSSKNNNNKGEFEGVHHFVLSEELIRKLTIQQIYDRAVNIIPKEKWSSFVSSVFIAKAFNSNSFESIQYRRDLVTVKCLAVAAGSSCSPYAVMTSAVFDDEPYLMSYMSDLINPDNIVPLEVSFAALRAFFCISGKRGSSDLMRALGGNVNHGLLLHILKYVLKFAKDDRTDMDQAYLNYYFNLLANLIDNKHLVPHLRSAGLLEILLEFLTLRNKFRMTRSGPLQLIELFIKILPDLLDDFIAQNGFNILIDLLKYEVDFALENPNYDGGAPKDAIVTHSISVRQVKTINSTLKLTLYLLKNHHGDRMRNLFDSNILKSLIKIIENPTVFGVDLLSDTILIITSIMNNEPTSFSILKEAGVIDTFFNHFSNFLTKSTDLLAAIPEAFSAIGLNKEGLRLLRESDCINRFLQIFKDVELCKLLLKDDNCSLIGYSMNELARHHPELKPLIEKAVIKLFNEIPDLLNFEKDEFYQSKQGSLCHSRQGTYNKFEDGKIMETWETSASGNLLEATLMFMSCLFDNKQYWTKMGNAIDPKLFIKYIAVPNITFDYVFSNSLYSLTTILKLFSSDIPYYGLNSLLDAIADTLKDLKEFTHYDRNDVSFFAQFENKENGDKEGGYYMSKLCSMNSLLYVFSDVYAMQYTSVTNLLCVVTKLSEDSSIKIIDELVQFYRRTILEEILINVNTPEDIIEEITSVGQELSPSQIRIGPTGSKTADWDGTSAQYKNLSILMFHYVRCQSWLRYICAFISRLPQEKRIESPETARKSMKIVVSLSRSFVSILNNIPNATPEIESAYYLIVSNIIYMLIVSRDKRGFDAVNYPITISLFQFNGFKKMAQLVIQNFSYLSNLSNETVEKYKALDYVSIEQPSTNLKLIDQLLMIIVAIGEKHATSSTNLYEKLYHHIKKDDKSYASECEGSLIVQASFISYGILTDLLSSNGVNILEKNPENLTTGMVEKIIILSKQFYCSYSNTLASHLKFEGRLYEIDSRNTVYSEAKLNYLVELGVPEDMAIDSLIFFRDAIEKIEPSYLSDINVPPEVCEGISERLKSFEAEPPKLIEPQYSHLCKVDDLIFARGANETNFIEYWLEIAQLFPKSVHRISELLNQLIKQSSYGDTMEIKDILETVFSRIISFDFESSNTKDSTRLSSMLSLLGLLLETEDDISESIVSLFDSILDFIKDIITPESANKVWFSRALFVYEKLLRSSSIPQSEPPARPGFAPRDAKFKNTYQIDEEIKEKIFKQLLLVEEITEVETALGVSRILVLYCLKQNFSSRICGSKTLLALIKSVQKLGNSDVHLQVLVITLVRFCMESNEIIQAYITQEVTDMFKKKPRSFDRRAKAPILDLHVVLNGCSNMILRSDYNFVESFSELVVFDDFSGLFDATKIRLMTPEEKKSLNARETSEDISKSDSTDVQMTDLSTSQNTGDLNYSTGIMQILLSELMTLTKKDLLSSPLDQENEKSDLVVLSKGNQELNFPKEIIFRNENCSYACFLLQTITELLLSYKQAKMEFLRFSKKNGDVSANPRSTALNMMLYSFIYTDPFDKTLSAKRKRRQIYSTLAKKCISALISTVPIKGIDPTDFKLVDPDMTFVRKFAVDIIIKFIIENDNTTASSFIRYGKTVEILNLVSGLLGSNNRQGLATERILSQNDSSLITKEFLDKKFPTVVTSVLGDLDVNFPHTEEVASSVMNVISRLGSIKSKHAEFFSEAHTDVEEEEPIADDDIADEDEETPDLLRNSTLGMYDVEDIEDEYDDGEDEFYDDDIEIVYSDDDDDDVDTDGDDGDIEEIDENFDTDDEMDIGDIRFNESDSELDEDGSDVSDADVDENDSIDEDEMYDDYYDNEDSEDVSDSESNEGRQFNDIIEILSDMDSENEADNGEGSSENSDYDDEDDDSAIIDEWLEQDTANRRRRSNNYYRNLLDDDAPSTSDEDQLRDDDELDGDDTDVLRYDINPFLGQERASMGDSVLPNTVQMLVNELDANGNNHLRRLPIRMDGMFPNGVNRGSLQLQSGGSLSDIIRTLAGHRSDFTRNKKSEDVPNLTILSTFQRWKSVATLFFNRSQKKSDVCRISMNIFNRIYERSLKLHEAEVEAAQKKKLEEQKAREIQAEKEKAELERIAKEEELARAAEAEDEDKDHDEADSDLEAGDAPEPVYISIGDRDVDISGTDIDPEFLLALPEDMREEVLSQHIRERRAEASSSGNHIREVDDEFMQALPADLRDEIFRYEYRSEAEARLVNHLNESIPEDDHQEEGSDGNEEVAPVRKNAKVYFSPMIDKFGVAAIFKMIFVPQLYYKRQGMFSAVSYLCHSKQTRGEVVALLLLILHESLSDKSSLENIYQQLCSRAKLPEGTISSFESPKKKSITIGPKRPNVVNQNFKFSFPIGCTTLTVATQAIDLLQYLLENESHMRLHLLMDQENNSFIRRLGKIKKLKDNSHKYPINVLLNLLDTPLIKNDTNLLDTLSRTIQIATKPLQTIKMNLDEINKDPSKKEKIKKLPQLPSIPDKNLRLVINILVADDCASKVFQQTISSIQNLSLLENGKKVFPKELTRKAMSLSQSISKEIQVLIDNMKTFIEENHDVIEDIPSLEKFSSAASNQAKLLRILTALDYLFQIKDDEDENNADITELRKLYKNSALGPLWGALSDCLRMLNENSSLTPIATVLSPLIEALMVVCKHSNVEDLPIRDVLNYEEKRRDYTKEPIESLFFSFTDEHKKILNQMVRNNPKLMSGSFSVLIRNPKVLEFDNKRVYFEQKLHENVTDVPTLPVNVRRDQVFLDSYRALFFKNPEEVRKAKLEIQFKGEQGVDAGGLTREWYQVLSRQMFNPDYALFTPVASDKTTFHPNRTSWVNPEHLSFFKFVGTIIGKAVYDNCMLDCHFSRAVYKRILGRPVSLKDMESLDLDYYKSLVWMLENDITDIIVETFSVETDDYGEHKIIDLIEDGRNVSVTEENKRQYVKLIVEYRLQTSVKDQMENFLQGFHSVIPKELVAVFDDQELELLISGLPEIDVDDWKNNTVYQNYSASSPQVQWFWRAVKSFDQEEKAKLLQFSTGTSKVPLNGFKELTGMSGVAKFSIHRVYDNTDRLPSSHTCFNQVDLPEYESYEKLRNALLLAITEGHVGFGFA